MATPEKKPKTQKRETESDDKSKRSSEEIARMIHPHDDEPDPTAYMGNYNFPQMLFTWGRWQIGLKIGLLFATKHNLNLFNTKIVM